MSQPISVDILSDSDSDTGGNWRYNLREVAIDLTTPSPSLQSKKKQRTEGFSNPSNPAVFIIDDDPTPRKDKTSSLGRTSPTTPSSLGRTSPTTPSFVAETPFSDASIVKCSYSREGLATEHYVVPDTPMSEHLNTQLAITKCNTEVTKGWICVESDTESGNVGEVGSPKNKESLYAPKLVDELKLDSTLFGTSFSIGISDQSQKKHTQSPVKLHILEGCSSRGDVMSDADENTDGKASKMDHVDQILSSQDNSGCYIKEKTKVDKTVKPKRSSKEERLRLMEEKRKNKEQEKLLKAASKAEAAVMKKNKKEMRKWEKGKYALKSIVAEIDKKVVEQGSIGGHLLTRFAEKGLSYRITSNPVEGTIVWSMVVPEEISTIASERIEISYVLIVYEAEEFCNLIMNDSLMGHVQNVQLRYPHHTICYVTNRLMAHINKREQAQYKNPASYTGWKRPAIEEVLANFTTQFFRVHSRQCVDEAELAEHVVGLTSSLASCQFRKRLTRLSVNANGSVIPHDCIDKNLIKKNMWLKALVAIPKVQPRFAIAIWKKYPTMKSLLRVYLDPTKSVHEKEFLLKELTTEGLLGEDRRLGEVCSKRIYRILMAQSGKIKTDDVELGADFFSHQAV